MWDTGAVISTGSAGIASSSQKTGPLGRANVAPALSNLPQISAFGGIDNFQQLRIQVGTPASLACPYRTLALRLFFQTVWRILPIQLWHWREKEIGLVNRRFEHYAA